MLAASSCALCTARRLPLSPARRYIGTLIASRHPTIRSLAALSAVASVGRGHRAPHPRLNPVLAAGSFQSTRPKSSATSASVSGLVAARPSPRSHASSTATSASAIAPASTSPSSSTDTAASLSRNFQPKVEVLPFRLGTDDARDYLRTWLSQLVGIRFRTPWERLKYAFDLFFNRRNFNDMRDELVKLTKISAVYLPIWIVDASFEIKCRGEDGRADVTFVTAPSRFPGHTWKPMDSMPMFPPQPADAIPKAELVNPTIHIDDRDYLLMMDYELYDPEKHLKPKDVDIKGGIPPPLPFTVSPLHLPEMLRNHLDVKDASFAARVDKGFSMPDNACSKEEWDLFVGEGLELPTVKFEPETLKIDVFAAYPILMPLHLAKARFKTSQGETKTMNVALAAWNKRKEDIAFKLPDSHEWLWDKRHNAPFDVHMIDLFPKLPIKCRLTDFFAKRRQEEEERWKKVRKERTQRMDEFAKKGKELLGTRLKAKRQELWNRCEEMLDEEKFAGRDETTFKINSHTSEASAFETPVRMAVMEKSTELLKRTEWLSLEREEREAYQTRTSSVDPIAHAITASDRRKLAALSVTKSSKVSPTEPRPFRWLRDKAARQAEIEHPDRRAGLGEYIYWTAPHVQRLSLSIHQNRRYLADAVPNLLSNRKRLANIAALGINVDSTNLIVEADGETKRGQEAAKTIRSLDLESRLNHERLKPRWLKELEGTVPPMR